MKKYFYIYKTSFIEAITYIPSILFKFVSFFVMMFILFNLWEYMYSDPNELINGYTMGQMTWYVIVTEILWMSLGGRKLCRKISDDVRGGNIAYNLNKPYNYLSFIYLRHECVLFRIHQIPQLPQP